MPKNKFKGTYEALQEQVERTGIIGEWSEQNNNGVYKQYTTEDGAILNWWIKKKTIYFQGADDVKIPFETAFYNSSDAENATAPAVRIATTPRNNKTQIFIVHGHDRTSRDQLELILRQFGLIPYILQNNNAQSKTLIEALEKQIYDEAAFGIILMTPDDYGYSKNENEENRQHRARQNVILEMGMVLASLGRKKTVILKKGNIEIPSDVNGVIYLEFNDQVREIAIKLARQMQGAGIEIQEDLITEAAT